MNGLVAVAIIILVTASISLASGQRVDTLRARVTIDVKLDYLTFLPRDYDKDPSKKWPLMIFLHGAGERGSEIEKVKTHGPPKIVAFATGERPSGATTRPRTSVPRSTTGSNVFSFGSNAASSGAYCGCRTPMRVGVA